MNDWMWMIVDYVGALAVMVVTPLTYIEKHHTMAIVHFEYGTNALVNILGGQLQRKCRNEKVGKRINFYNSSNKSNKSPKNNKQKEEEEEKKKNIQHNYLSI